MVSPTIIQEIQRRYEAIKHQSLDLHKYSGELFDVACEIITADSFIAGVASKILDGSTIEPIERALAQAPLLIERRLWRRDNGQLVDVSQFDDIYDLANGIETLRSLCDYALR